MVYRPDHASLVVHGRDQPGIVAVVTEVLARHGANIVALDQHSDDPEGGAFFQRTVFHLSGYPARCAAQASGRWSRQAAGRLSSASRSTASGSIPS